jgi:ribonuclease T1
MRKLGLAVVLASILATGFAVSAVAAVPAGSDGSPSMAGLPYTTAPALSFTPDIAREFAWRELQVRHEFRPEGHGSGVRQDVRDTRPAHPHDTTVAHEALPPEARSTHELILRGGPFPHSKDGTVFGNRERQLPPRPRGQYREYTVRTPGLSHRGARRIVCGGQQPARPEVCYYTADHYASFRRIAQ